MDHAVDNCRPLFITEVNIARPGYCKKCPLACDRDQWDILDLRESRPRNNTFFVAEVFVTLECLLYKFVLIYCIFPQNCIARALYDNVAESPDELAFRRGDILTVLEQNTAGLEGWWLCSLKGRQGICPGNRLRILPGVYDTGSGVTTLSSLTQQSNSPPSNLTANTPSAAHLRATATSPGPRNNQRPLSNKVVTPRRVGDVYTYDTPRTLTSSPQQMDYDVPPTRHSPHDSGGLRLTRSSSLRYDTPRPLQRSSLEQYDVPRPQYDSPKVRPLYDSPRPQHQQQQHYDSPRPQIDNAHTSSPPPKSMIKGVRGGLPRTDLHLQNQQKILQQQQQQHQEYDVPRPANLTLNTNTYDVPPSDRSSGVSVMSCESTQSHLSTSSSASSIAASESLSLSSFGGSSNRSSLESHDVYDIPPSARPVSISQKPKLPPRENKDPRGGECYDVPRSAALFGNSNTYDTPPMRAGVGTTVLRGGEGVYDVPPQVCRDVKQSDTVDSAPCRLSSGSDSSAGELDITSKELHLELDSALDILMKYQQEVYSAIEKVATVNSGKNWQQEEPVVDIRSLVGRLQQALHDILAFAQGASGNAAKSGEKGIARRLQKLIEPMSKSAAVMDVIFTQFQSEGNKAGLSRNVTAEQLSQLAVLGQSLTEEVRHLANIIQSNANLIFKKAETINALSKNKQYDDDEKTPVQERPLPDLPQKKSLTENTYENNEARTWLDDYDYVNLEARESLEREHEEIKKELPAQLRKSFDNLVKQSQIIVDSDHEKALTKGNVAAPNSNKQANIVLDANDRQVVNFYGNQGEIHLQHLNTAIDAFLLTVENNQPPKVFIAHSKFVILNAHKLVYIGDTVHRNVKNAELRTRVLNCSNALCDAMKNTVSAAKTAALQFPSVGAVQSMVDAFVSVSHLAYNLKQAISSNLL
ncbi:unnamed protein product, partial [Meganyctiphanes norvegica]